MLVIGMLKFIVFEMGGSILLPVEIIPVMSTCPLKRACIGGFKGGKKFGIIGKFSVYGPLVPFPIPTTVKFCTIFGQILKNEFLSVCNGTCMPFINAGDKNP